ncbi:hypothetical protein [Catellatospora sp. NPDC049609]|uniref:hypothetical protein n=1 Tax=Catellatospora sp. NPDC049609 TaxID=3155505 RepID=UPI00341D03A4
MDTTLSRVWDHTHGKSVRPGTSPRRVAPGRGGLPLAELARRHPVPVAVLRTVLSPRRWEPWNTFNEHRVYPSPRAAWLVDVSIVDGARRLLVDPVRDRLVQAPAGPDNIEGSSPDVGAPAGPVRREGSSPGGGALAGSPLVGDGGRPVSGDGLTLELSLHPERLPTGYGALAEALVLLEAGHVAAALADAAAEHGWRADTAYGDSGLTVTLRPDGAPAAGHGRVAGRRAAYRSSGLSPRGLHADPRPLPGGTLDLLAAAAHRPPAGSPAAWPGLRHRAVAARVAGLAPGLYAADGPAPRLLAEGVPMDRVQEAFTMPREAVDVAGMNLAWAVTADVTAAVRDGGAAGYHRLLLAAGAFAQHVAVAAGAAGLMCRPVRSVREARLEAAVGAPPTEDFLYLLLVGRSRVRDFAYDLSPPEVLP